MSRAAPRRDFLKHSSLGIAGAAALGLAAPKVFGANERLTIGLVGCGGRGTHVAELFAQGNNVQLAYFCDPDQGRLERAAARLADHANGAKLTPDLRQILDDAKVDAIIVATPDHWHAPASILACQAGKHVYVEKPCSHNVVEGRLLVQAARRHKCLVQHGTQCRSTGMIRQAVQILHQGAIGRVLIAKAWNIQRRGGIGRAQPSEAPPGLDYDLWVGPAPMIPYQANRCHSGWHWWFAFGTGDMGNDGVHDIDYARWGLGVETHPSFVSAAGGKYVFDDDQEFPDTQQVTFEYPGDGKPGSKRMLIYEQRLWSTNYPYNVDSGVEFYGTSGQMFLSRRGKVQVLGERNAKVDVNLASEAQNEGAHIKNFCDAVRGTAQLHAEIEVGHLSTSLCHLGNIATRLGRALRFDPLKEQIVGDEEANGLLTRQYRDHWAAPRRA